MNKVALVTGSSSGIGKSTIIEYAKNDYDIVITYNKNENEALKLEQHIKENYNVETLVVNLNVQDENNIQECIKKY